MVESQTATTYPTQEQYQRWREEAEQRGMSVSEFIQAMTEAGLKNFAIDVNPDESHQELREHRNELKRELDRARNRLSTLEEQLHDQEAHTIREYIESNPGTTFEDILQRLIDSAPRRVNTHLHSMEGDAVRVEDGRYYPADQSGNNEEGNR